MTLYRAARRSGRRLVVDLYTADVLLQAPVGSGLPRPDRRRFPGLHVMITPALVRRYKAMGREDHVQQVLETGRATSRAQTALQNAIVMTRASLLRDYERGNLLQITRDDAFVHSSWAGYIDKCDPRSPWMRAGYAGARRALIHASGHAAPADLKRFACQVAPRNLVPVHGVQWDLPGIALPPIMRLGDGDAWSVPVKPLTLFNKAKGFCGG